MSVSNALLNRLRDLTVARPRPKPLRYGMPVLVIAVVASAQATLFGSSAPWFLYTPAVVLLALFLGRGPGVLATILSAVCAGLVVARPGLPLLLAPVHWGASAIFLLTTLGLVVLVEALRTALLNADRLREERERALVVTAERESFLSGALASSTDCIKVLDLDGKLTFMSEGGQRVMEVSDFNTVAGCPWPDFWRDAGNVEAREAVEAARDGQARNFIGKADTFMVVCEALDRIARDGEDINWLGKKLRFDHVRLVTATEGEIDEIKLAVAGLLGSMFLSNLRHKTFRGMQAAVLAGRLAGGRAYGYRKNWRPWW